MRLFNFCYSVVIYIFYFFVSKKKAVEEGRKKKMRDNSKKNNTNGSDRIPWRGRKNIRHIIICIFHVNRFIIA